MLRTDQQRDRIDALRAELYRIYQAAERDTTRIDQLSREIAEAQGTAEGNA